MDQAPTAGDPAHPRGLVIGVSSPGLAANLEVHPLSARIRCSCGRSYWPQQAWIHGKCRVAVNDVPSVATNEDATNGVNSSGGGVSARTANRRRREDYNAFQRELMRKRRAAARAGFAEKPG